MSMLSNLVLIAVVGLTLAVSLPNVYPPKTKKPVDTSWTAEDNDAMRKQCPPISKDELGKHGRTSPLTIGLQAGN